MKQKSVWTVNAPQSCFQCKLEINLPVNENDWVWLLLSLSNVVQGEVLKVKAMVQFLKTLTEEITSFNEYKLLKTKLTRFIYIYIL